MSYQLDMIRKLFLEKQLTMLPEDVIAIIRNYDNIHRDHFTKTVLKNLTYKVYVFWHNKMLKYSKNYNNNYDDFETYIKKIDDYYDILWKVLIIPPINYKSSNKI